MRSAVSCTIILLLLSIMMTLDQENTRSSGEPGGFLPLDGPVLFQNVSEEAGLSGLRGNFFSWGDYDRDGYQDLLVDGKRLFRNEGPPSYNFVEVTGKAGIYRIVNSGVWGDYDNDGWMDLFCGGGRGSNDHPEYPDVLWHNERDGTFRDMTVRAGDLSDTFPTVASAWCDHDRDGDLDLFMANYENGSLKGYPNHFWENRGDGTFENTTLSSGLAEPGTPYPSSGASWADMDNDMWPDLYISNYRIMRNYLYRNLGFGSMEEQAEDLGVEGHGNPHPITGGETYYGHSLGSSWGDLDNDGDLDLWVTNLAHKDAYRGPICDDSYLFENLGKEGNFSFADRREESGIEVKRIPGTLRDGDELMVSSSLADYDNDGDLDLFIPQIYHNISYSHSFLYQNRGDMTFVDVAEEAGVRVWNTYGSAWCDYDRDGWIDLITGGGHYHEEEEWTKDYQVHLFRNTGGDSGNSMHWVEVELEGRISNTAAVGARVRVDADRDGDGTWDLSMIREVNGGTAAHGQQDSMVQHFGLGGELDSMDITVFWPSGRVTVLEDTTVDMIHRVFEPTDELDVEMELTGSFVEGKTVTLVLELNSTSGQTVKDIVFNVSTGDGVPWFTSWYREGVAGGTRSEVSLTGRIPEGAGPLQDLEITITLDISFPEVSAVPLRVDGGSLINGPPVAIIEGPEKAKVGETVTFSGGSSSDPDDDELQFRFDFGDGWSTEWDSSPEAEHAYSEEGDYTVLLSVRDGHGNVAPADAEHIIKVESIPIGEPAARIVAIEPDLVEYGTPVSFRGEGTPSEGEVVVAHEWASSIDGILSEEARFTRDDLSIGYHLIAYRVRDSGGTWSDEDNAYLEVLERDEEDLWVSIDDLPGDGPWSGPVMVRGTSGPNDRIAAVEVRLDSDPWGETSSYPDWEYLVDCSQLSPGEHIIYARSTDGKDYSQYDSMIIRVEGNQRLAPNTPSPGNGGGGIEPVFLIMVSVILLGVALLLVYMWKTSRGKDPLEGMKGR